ncbi:glycine betaine ABC transporter substrate-binding protein [Rhodococcus aerolatus]
MTAPTTARPRRTRRALAAVALAASASLAAGCGLQSGSAVPLAVDPGSIQPVDSLKGVDLTVGSKEFTEQRILGYIIEFALSAAGANVSDLTSIVGSNSTRQALVSGQVDVTYEYTGTGWLSYLGQEKPIADPVAQYEAVKELDLKENGVAWVDPAPMDNTYALAMSQQVAQQTGITTLSEYAELVKSDPNAAGLCVETEFNSRPDGLPGLAAAYGFDVAAVPTQILQTGVIYNETANGNCKFGEVFTTDGRIKGLDLTVLQDDKAFFPHYNATITLLQKTLDEHPAIAEVMKPVSDALTNEEITELNRKVDVDGSDPADVARQWMADKGFITIP